MSRLDSSLGHSERSFCNALQDDLTKGWRYFGGGESQGNDSFAV